MTKKVWMGVGIAALMAIFGIFGFLFSGSGSTYYYSQIDNSKLEQVKSKGGVIDFSGGLPYSYTLFSYDENGNGKDITFGTSRELKEGALIRLTVVPLRGTIEWKELRYDELPASVQAHYTPSD